MYDLRILVVVMIYDILEGNDSNYMYIQPVCMKPSVSVSVCRVHSGERKIRFYDSFIHSSPCPCNSPNPPSQCGTAHIRTPSWGRD